MFNDYANEASLCGKTPLLKFRENYSGMRVLRFYCPIKKFSRGNLVLSYSPLDLSYIIHPILDNRAIHIELMLFMNIRTDFRDCVYSIGREFTLMIHFSQLCIFY